MDVVFERIAARAVEGPTVSPELGPCLDSLYAGSWHPTIHIRGDRQRSIPRLVLERKLGRPIAPGMQANHLCDRPKCIRPEHLYEGSQGDNIRDAFERGRIPPHNQMHRPEVVEKVAASLRGRKRLFMTGERHPLVRLNDEAVKVIRFLAAKGYSYNRLANAYGVSNGCVNHIINRRSWRHVPDYITTMAA